MLDIKIAGVQKSEPKQELRDESASAFGVAQWRQAVALAFVAAALWGVNGLFVRDLSGALGASDWTILFLRHGFSGALLLLVFWAQRLRGKAYMTKKGFFWSCVTGIVGLFVSNICNLYVMRTVSVTAAVMLTNTSVVFVLIFGAIFARALPTKAQIAGSLLAFLGAGLVTWQASAEASCGFLPAILGLASGVASGIYPFFFAKALDDGTSPVAATGVALALAGVVSSPFACASMSQVPSASLLGLIAVGFACAMVTRALPQLAYAKAVAIAEPKKDTVLPALAVITTFEVVVAAITSWAFLGEHFGWLKVAGVFTLVLASALVNLSQKETAET